MRRKFSSKLTLRGFAGVLQSSVYLYKQSKFYLILVRSPKHLVLSVHRRKASVSVHLDCKTVRIFAYSSTREQSNKRCGTRLKTESETGERRACEVRVVRARKTLTPRVSPSRAPVLSFARYFQAPATQATLYRFLYWFWGKNRLSCSLRCTEKRRN